MIDYTEFEKILENRILNGQEFYNDLLEKLVSNPERYAGLFRLSNAKTKLVQNITQSIEIKFGDFLEEIVTRYIALFGYNNLPKDLGFNSKGDRLNADQLFELNNTLFFVEQKVRDDHDSTKKRGQFENFVKKIKHLKHVYPNHQIEAAMWFIDPSLTKNRNYYIGEMNNLNIHNVNTHLYYGDTFFDLMLDRNDAWEELIENLRTRRETNSDMILEVPDLDTENEGKTAIENLKVATLKKLCSDEEKYVLLREELFKTGNNFKAIRDEAILPIDKLTIIKKLLAKYY